MSPERARAREGQVAGVGPRPSKKRRLARLGRLRAVLRLGERADPRPPRRGILAARRVGRGRPGPRARLRHRPCLAAPSARGRRSRRRRPLGPDARPGGPSETRARPGTRAAAVRARGYPGAAVPSAALLDGHRPVRDPAVADPSERPASGARLGRSRPEARWAFRARSRSGRPHWREYQNRVQLRGRAGRAHLTLVETVRQDRARRLTIFEQCYRERRGRRRSSTGSS